MRSDRHREGMTASKALGNNAGGYEILSKTTETFGKGCPKEAKLPRFVQKAYHQSFLLRVNSCKLWKAFLLKKLVAHLRDSVLFFSKLLWCKRRFRSGRLYEKSATWDGSSCNQS